MRRISASHRRILSNRGPSGSDCDLSIATKAGVPCPTIESNSVPNIASVKTVSILEKMKHLVDINYDAATSILWESAICIFSLTCCEPLLNFLIINRLKWLAQST